MSIGYDVLDCMLGRIYVVASEAGVMKIELVEELWNEDLAKHAIERRPDLCRSAIKQLEEYFQGKRTKFELELQIEGTEFRKKVWDSLMTIPYGKAISYSELAVQIGNPKAVRAVGQANRHNPIPIIIPCHRVIGKDKSLTGYAGTRTDIKEKLLSLENVQL